MPAGRSLVLLGLVSILSTFGGTSFAQVCKLGVYEPLEVYNALNMHLVNRGVATVGFALPERGGPLVNVKLYKENRWLGNVLFVDNVRKSLTSLTVTAPDGGVLFTQTSEQKVCHAGGPGLCRHVRISTELQPEIAGAAAFSLVYDADTYFAPRYYRYDTEVPALTWSIALRESLAWLEDTLMTNASIVDVSSLSDLDRALIRLAQDPILLPYVGHLSVNEENGYYVLRGTVPSYGVYQTIIGQFLAAGIYNIRPLIVIDTRMRKVFLPAPNFQCYFQ